MKSGCVVPLAAVHLVVTPGLRLAKVWLCHFRVLQVQLQVCFLVWKMEAIKTYLCVCRAD